LAYNTFFYGLKTSLGVSIKNNHGKISLLSPGALITHDYIFIKRSGYTDYKTDFVFSTLGVGALIDVSYLINSRFSLGLEGGGSYNFIALTPLSGDFIRSYGYFIKGSFSVFL
jgi:hypothetical protein